MSTVDTCGSNAALSRAHASTTVRNAATRSARSAAVVGEKLWSKRGSMSAPHLTAPLSPTPRGSNDTRSKRSRSARGNVSATDFTYGNPAGAGSAGVDHEGPDAPRAVARLRTRYCEVERRAGRVAVVDGHGEGAAFERQPARVPVDRRGGGNRNRSREGRRQGRRRANHHGHERADHPNTTRSHRQQGNGVRSAGMRVGSLQSGRDGRRDRRPPHRSRSRGLLGI